MEVVEDIGDRIEGVVEVFRGTIFGEEVVAVGVFDEEISVGNVITELGDVVEASLSGSVGCKAAGFPAGFHAGDDGFQRGELRVVSYPTSLLVSS